MTHVEQSHLQSWLFDVRNGNHLTEDIIRERLAALEGNTAPLAWDGRYELHDGLRNSLAYHIEPSVGEIVGKE